MIRELGTKYSVQICALPLQTCKDVCFGKMYSGAVKMKRQCNKKLYFAGDFTIKLSIKG